MHKVAILIDGGYFLKRLPKLHPEIDMNHAQEVTTWIERLVQQHLFDLNKTLCVSNPCSILYRAFYYDAKPYDQKGHLPISNKPSNYGKSKQAIFRNELFDILRRRPNFAVRLGDVRKVGRSSWILKSAKQKQLLKREIQFNNLVDEDFSPALQQKGVDMRIGLDIASITLKHQANIIILVSGDEDFVPAAKLARREGVQFILDPLWQKVSPALFEHIDIMRSGFLKPNHAN